MAQYILRRLLMMIPTLIAITIVTFVLIQLPPGDYLTVYITEMENSGNILDQEEIAALRARYGLDEPMIVQFWIWLTGILRGDFGMSFSWNRPVKELIGERLALTVTISLITQVFVWIVAIPIGVYSATHQYSLGDYSLTFLGFIGRATPDFMLALILMWLALTQFNTSAGGLFSAQYRSAPWTWAKVVDLLKHMWVPMIVLGTSGTATSIRITRANLLDELHKPYVETARAKGLKERRLLWKYPVRISLNPFFSTVGWTLAALVSGSTIVSVVLNLPTTGPLLLSALKSQDMYLAGSFLFFLSILTVIGTLISDIVLALVDPRIRFSGSRR